jgi:hypothetical protein
MPQQKSKSNDLVAIGQALNEISWEWLSNNHPQLAEAIRTEMEHGATPGQIRRFVMRQTQRLELALRCEQAADFLLFNAG